MVEVGEILRTAAIILGTIVVYELLRFFVKRFVKGRFEKEMKRFLASPDLYHQHFKFTNRLIVKQQLLADPEINAKIVEFSKREGKPAHEVRAKVEGYVDEIVPNFNLLSYYKLGYTVARAFVNLLYDPVVDRESRKILETLPKNASPVYIMNHRSNVDFVLLAYILAGKVSISYAVGEWARVWPLEHLFKSFGSYLVRRGFKEDLYHKVLERYVQLTARHGVAQAIFPEGKITRDGYLMPPKYGLLGWLAGVEADPEFKGDLVFIPVGVNYDWVLEDYNLVAESEGRTEKAGFFKRFQVIVTAPFVFFALLIVNGVRKATGHLKLHGYASLAFGKPVGLKEFFGERGVIYGTLAGDERKPHIEALGAHLIESVGKSVPATPVTVVAMAILDSAADGFTRIELTPAVSRTRRALEERGVPFVHGREFGKIREALSLLEEEERPRGEELLDVGVGITEQEEAEEVARLGLDILRRNKILTKRGRKYFVREDKANYLRYYANSIAHHLGKRYAIMPQPGQPAARGPTEGSG